MSNVFCPPCNRTHLPHESCDPTSPSSDSFRWLSPVTIEVALQAMRANKHHLKWQRRYAERHGITTTNYDVWISDLTEAIKEMEARHEYQ